MIVEVPYTGWQINEATVMSAPAGGAGWSQSHIGMLFRLAQMADLAANHTAANVGGRRNVGARALLLPSSQHCVFGMRSFAIASPLLPAATSVSCPGTIRSQFRFSVCVSKPCWEASATKRCQAQLQYKSVQSYEELSS